MFTEAKYKIVIPPSYTEHDVHLRADASGLAWIGIYDRQQRTWTDTASGTLEPAQAVAVLEACGVRS